MRRTTSPGALGGPGQRQRPRGLVVVGPRRRPGSALERLVIDPAGQQVGVQAVDDRVGLGVVAEQRLGRGGRRRLAAAGQQRRQLVRDLRAQRAEPAAQDVAHVVLEDELVVGDAVERQLGGQHRAHLGRAAADDADLVAVGVRQRAQERGGAGVSLLVGGGLDRALGQIAEAVELGAQVGLVEVPAEGVTWRGAPARRRRRLGPAARARRDRRTAATARRPAAADRGRHAAMFARSPSALAGDLDRVGDRRARSSGRAP
jgi:hypothetical protein